MRYLNVPFAEKEAAKALGARWDSIARRWYIPQSLLAQQAEFAKWFLPEDQAILNTENSIDTPRKEEVTIVNSELQQTITMHDATGIQHSTLSVASIAVAEQKKSAKSLSQLLNQVSNVLQQTMAMAQWIVAEVASVQQRSGHYYLELTETLDSGQQIAKTRAMIWASNAKHLLESFQTQTGQTIQAGQKLLILVNVSFHSQYGFSLQIEDIDASYTLGELEKALNELRERLRREQRLERNKQFSVPKDFFKIAVVAPPNAAGLGDFKADADRLQQVGLCVFDYFFAAFQGDKAAIEIPAALNKISQEVSQTNPYDAVVIIRGGGAKLDLQQLNQYAIAFTLSEMNLPVLTGIGHEKDRCILDEMAAMSCDTPSKVIAYISAQIARQAQKAQQNWNFIEQKVQQQLHLKHQALESDFFRIQQLSKQSVMNLKVGLPQLQKQIEDQAWQTWRIWQARITPLVGQISKQARQSIVQNQQAIEKYWQGTQQQIHYQLTQQHQKCDAQISLVTQYAPKIVAEKRQAIQYAYQIVLNSGPKIQQNRGFVIAKDEAGNVLSTATQAAKSSKIELNFKDGKIWVKPTE